jgi:RHS repeat-associated protein
MTVLYLKEEGMLTSSSVFPVVRCLVFLAIAVLLTPTLPAQMPPSSSTTSTPVPGAGHDYLGEIAETVNPATGSTSIRLSGMMPPGRGLTLPFSFAYDSNGVNFVALNSGGVLWWATPSNTLVSSGGWSNSVPIVTFNEITWTAYADQGAKPTSCWGFVNYVYQDAHADRHNLNLTTYNQAGTDGPCTYYSPAPPGFGFAVVTESGEEGSSSYPGQIAASLPSNASKSPGPVTVVDADGTVLSFPLSVSDTLGIMPTSVEDRNGNLITISPPASQGKPYSYMDTAGRTVLQDSGFAVSPETVTIDGLNAPYTLQWTTLPTPSFTVPVVALSGSDCNFGGTHAPWDYGEYTVMYAISSLTLPNGKIFTFTYDPTYEVMNKMTYPTGGYIRYVWGINPQAEVGEYSNPSPQDQCTALYGVPVITDRYVSFNGSTEVLHQHFAYVTNWNTSAPFEWTSKQTTVTTTDEVRNTSYNTVYTYVRATADVPPNTGGGPTQWDPVESSIAYYDTNGNLLKTVYKTWANTRLLTSQETQYPSGLTNETTWTYNTRDQQTSKSDYDFAVTTTPPPTTPFSTLLRQVVTNYQQFNLSLYPNLQNIADRPCQVITYASAGSNRVAETDYFYDNGAATTPCGTAGTPSLTGAGGSSLTGHDETNYSATSTTPRGNLTQKTQWRSAGSPATTYSYDETGQVLSITDPCGNGTCSDMTGTAHTTTYSFADNYLNTNSSGFTTTAGSPPSGKVTNAYLTKVTYPTTNGVAHIENFSYGYNDGELTQSRDQNSQLTTYKYNDSLGRLTETDYPDTGQTLVTYNDAVPSVTTCQNINGTASATCSATSPATGWKTTLLTMDGLAHPVQTELASDPSGPTYTATVYDGSGRKYQIYNPTRCSSITTNCDNESTWGYSTTNYDALNRVTSVVEQDTSVVTTTYDQTNANSPGLCTTVTDEAGNSRQSCEDGIGRLTSVWEAPTSYNFETLYAYDALNDLLSVTQEGGSSSSNWRVRSFVYDSLSRLTSATNPESGTIAYAYDLNSNVMSKTAPLENQTGTSTVQTTYLYDTLDRLTKKSYNDGGLTPTVQFAYDAGTLTGCTEAPPALTDSYPIGRRTSMCDGAGGTSWSHDQLGRILIPRRQIASASPHELAYTYNLDGSLATHTQSDGSGGKTITYTTGGAGLPLAAQDASGNMFVKSATYAPFGGLTSMINGYTSSFAGITTTNQYNSRLQPSVFSASTSSATVFSQSYGYGTSGHDNGNVYQVVNNLNNERTQNFTYDSVNRILTAASQATSGTYCWGQNISIDAWGNLNQITASQCSAPTLTQTSNTNNQIVGFCYDAAGNLLDEFACPSGNHTFVYDAEGQLLYTAGYSYLYDGDGQRVAKCTSTGQSSTCPTTSTGTIYLRNLGNESALETDLSGNVQNEYIFFNGDRVVRSDSNYALHYYFHNHLMTTEVVTNAVGATPPQQDVDYTPYGAIIDGTPSEHYLFTGKERDSESGLDNFGARYFTSSLGRFMTPDWAARPTAVPYAVFGDPQSLNLYTYVRNDPVTRADADGHCHPANPYASCSDEQESLGGKGDPPKAQNQVEQVQVVHQTQTSTQNSDGTTTVVTTATSASFSTKKGEEGKFLGASQSINTMVLGPDGTKGVVSSTDTYNGNLSYGGAVKAMGASAMAAGAEAALPSFARQFARALGRDAYHHPFRMIGRAIAIGALSIDPPTTPLGAGLAVGGAAADLGESVQHANEEQ